MNTIRIKSGALAWKGEKLLKNLKKKTNYKKPKVYDAVMV